MKKKTGIISAIVVLLLPVAQNVISHKIEDFDYWNGVKVLYSIMKNIMCSILSFKIPVWIIMIFTILILLSRALIISTKKSPKKSKTPEWEKYKTEKYDGLIYTWDVQNVFGEKKIINLKPICECGCDLIKKDSYKNRFTSRGYLVCPNCKKGYENNFEENEEAVNHIIVFKHNSMIKKYQSKQENKLINVDTLTSKEKTILKKFFVKELGKYTEKKRIIKDNETIELLIERKIIKKQTEQELIDNYTSKGTYFELTKEALEELNRNL